MGATFCDPPEFIPALVTRAREGSDVVYVARPADKQPLFRRLMVSLFFRIADRLIPFPLRRDATEFRVLSRRAVNAIVKLKEHNRYMPLLYEYVGFTVATIPFEGDRSRWVRRPYSYRMKVHWAVDAIVAFSDRPLRYAALLSLLISLSCLVGTVCIVVEKLVSNTAVEGWTPR